MGRWASPEGLGCSARATTSPKGRDKRSLAASPPCRLLRLRQQLLHGASTEGASRRHWLVVVSGGARRGIVTCLHTWIAFHVELQLFACLSQLGLEAGILLLQHGPLL